jgi:hypothetical protein
MPRKRELDHPVVGSWWIEPGRVLGGCYPGDIDRDQARYKLNALLDTGVRRIICLQPEEERGSGGRPFVPYTGLWHELATARGLTVDWQRHPIRDMDVPSGTVMRAALGAIASTEGVAYVHCWGGHGRTGTVGACWLAGRGLEVEEAFERIRRSRQHDRHLRSFDSPQTDAQRAFVRSWAESEER